MEYAGQLRPKGQRALDDPTEHGLGRQRRRRVSKRLPERAEGMALAVDARRARVVLGNREVRRPARASTSDAGAVSPAAASARSTR
eukprot:scaffold6313_cov113-Isochrysis_galbana.AAC.1